MIDCSEFTLERRVSSHAEALFEVLSDASLYEYIDEDPPASVGALRRRLAGTETGRSPDGRHHWLNWVIRIRSGEIAGFVQATIDLERRCSVAYVLGKKFWGHNLATRAVEQMLLLLARQYAVTVVTVSIDAANRRSIKLAERTGFVPVAACVPAKEKIDNEVILEKRF